MRKNKFSLSGKASPGDGMTVASLSKDPLATEGEATPGPDDHNPFEDPAVGSGMDTGTGFDTEMGAQMDSGMGMDMGGFGGSRRMAPERNTEEPMVPAPDPGPELDIDGEGGLPPLLGGD